MATAQNATQYRKAWKAHAAELIWVAYDAENVDAYAAISVQIQALIDQAAAKLFPNDDATKAE